MNLTDLSVFCHSERFKLQKPWVEAEMAYAANGKICVRTPTPGEPDSDWKHPSAAFLFAEFPVCDIPLTWNVLSKSSASEEKCLICCGSGAHQCPLCPHMHKCKACAGTGKRRVGTWSVAGVDHDVELVVFILQHLAGVRYSKKHGRDGVLYFTADGNIQGTLAALPYDYQTKSNSPAKA